MLQGDNASATLDKIYNIENQCCEHALDNSLVTEGFIPHLLSSAINSLKTAISLMKSLKYKYSIHPRRTTFEPFL